MIKHINYSPFHEEKAPSVSFLVDKDGREVLDKTPVSIPIPLTPPPSSFIELMHRMYLNMRDEGNDVETFEDADDFDVPDELGIEMRSTPYEQDFDHFAEDTTPPAGADDVPSQSEKVEEKSA